MPSSFLTSCLSIHIIIFSPYDRDLWMLQNRGRKNPHMISCGRKQLMLWTICSGELYLYFFLSCGRHGGPMVSMLEYRSKVWVEALAGEITDFCRYALHHVLLPCIIVVYKIMVWKKFWILHTKMFMNLVQRKGATGQFSLSFFHPFFHPFLLDHSWPVHEACLSMRLCTMTKYRTQERFECNQLCLSNAYSI